MIDDICERATVLEISGNVQVSTNKGLPTTLSSPTAQVSELCRQLPVIAAPQVENPVIQGMSELHHNLLRNFIKLIKTISLN